MQPIKITTYSGSSARPFFEDMARLRIEVFRDFPYLYEGTEDYEVEYLGKYFSCDESVLVVASEGSRIVGVSTGIPLAAAEDAFRTPLVKAGFKESAFFYFGESVLLMEHRGRGIGHRFFDEREQWAYRNGYTTTGFCSVVREAEHPLKPEGYHDHSCFWAKRGYKSQEDIRAYLPWKEIGKHGEIDHELVFWLR